MTLEIIAIIGAISAIIGSVILALSLGGIFREISTAIGFLNISAESIARGGDRFIFDGIQERIERAKKKSFIPTIIGLTFLVNSFLCQAITIGMSQSDSLKTKRQIRNIESKLNELNSLVQQNHQNSQKIFDQIRTAVNNQETLLENTIKRITAIENQIKPKQ